jgi:predicted dehydrogenase
MAPPSTRALRVGLLGYGLAGRVFHAPLIAASKDLSLAAVVSRGQHPFRRRSGEPLPRVP